MLDRTTDQDRQLWGRLLSPTVRDEWCADSKRRAKGAAWREAAQAGEAPRASAAKLKESSRDYRIHNAELLDCEHTALDVRACVLRVCVFRHVI